jgi:hypothetical protein
VNQSPKSHLNLETDHPKILVSKDLDRKVIKSLPRSQILKLHRQTVPPGMAAQLRAKAMAMEPAHPKVPPMRRRHLAKSRTPAELHPLKSRTRAMIIPARTRRLQRRRKSRDAAQSALGARLVCSKVSHQDSLSNLYE